MVDTSQEPYPAQGNFQPNPAQSALAWQLFKTGGITPGGAHQPGSVNYPRFAVPGKPSEAGTYIIDQAGKLRVAGQNDDGAPQPARNGDAFDDDGGSPSPWADVGKSLLNAPEHFVPDALGQIGNARDMINSAGDAAYNFIPHLTGAEPKNKWASAPMQIGPGPLSPFPGVDPVSMLAWAPDTQRLDKGQQQQFGQYYAPRTFAGRAASSTARFIPQTLAGGEGEIPIKLLQAAGSGIGSEALASAADASGHPNAEWLGRLIGAGAGGGMAGLPGRASTADKVLSSAAQNLTPEQLGLVESLRQSGEHFGVVPTTAEAAQQVTGNGEPLMAKLQQRVEQSKGGGPVMQDFLAGRQAAAHGAINQVLDRVSPTTDQPSMVGVNAQTAAKGAISGLEGEANAAASPYYTAAAPVTVDPAAMGDVMTSIRNTAAADKSGLISKPLMNLHEMLTDSAATDAAQPYGGSGSLRDQLERSWAEITGEAPPGSAAAAGAGGPTPILDIANLDRVRKVIRDNPEQFVPNSKPTGEQIAAVQAFGPRIDSLMEAASPDFVGGKATYGDMAQKVIAPAKAGPLGTISGTSDPATIASAVFPANPLPGASAETTAAVQALNQQDPAVAAMIARQHLERASNAAFADGRNGPNPYAPAQFAAKVAGNPEQANVLTAGLSAAAGPEIASHLADLNKVLAATGRRLPASPDEGLLAALNAPHPLSATELGVSAGVAKEAFGTVGGVLSAGAAKGLSKGLNLFQNWRTDSAAEELARALTGPADETMQRVMDAHSARAAEYAYLAHALANAGTAPSQGSRTPY